MKFKERRVKSALESRREQEASAIFPQVASSKLDPEWGLTKYSEDYGPKKRSTPVPVRPASPTRMHNPHPAKVGNMVLEGKMLTDKPHLPRDRKMYPNSLTSIQ